MSVRNFVSEKDIEDEKKRRQEEWDRVRQPGQPEVPPEPEDNRPLYERLKEQRERKQMEYEETHKLKNMLRGLDSEEVGFLDYVDELKRNEEQKRLKEERALLSEVKKHAAEAAVDPVDQLKISELTRKPLQASTSKSKEKNKQALLLAGAVKKRKAEEKPETQSEEKKIKPADNAKSESGQVVFPSAAVLAGIRISATKCGGVLPGLDTYDGDDSDDSSNSSSSDTDDRSDWMLYTNPVQLTIDKQKKQTEAANCKTSNNAN